MDIIRFTPLVQKIKTLIILFQHLSLHSLLYHTQSLLNQILQKDSFHGEEAQTTKDWPGSPESVCSRVGWPGHGTRSDRQVLEEAKRHQSTQEAYVRCSTAHSARFIDTF